MLDFINEIVLKVGAFIGGGLLTIGSLFSPVTVPQIDISLDQFGADNFTPVQAPKAKLAGSGVSATATSITLQSLKLSDASTTITMANFGDIGYGTLEPSTSREEQISFTGVTQNGDGTATLTGVTRGLSFTQPCAETSALKKAHAGGTIFVLSNTACFYAELPSKDNDESITGTWTFASSVIPRLGAQGTYGVGTEEYFATKRYVDGVATSGAPDASLTAKGLVEIGTRQELANGSTTGDTSAKLVPEYGYFSTTRVASTSSIPVTVSSTGYLSQTFIRLDEAWTFAATTTMASTTNIQGPLNVTSTTAFQGIVTFNSSTVGLLANNLIAATTTAVSNPNTTATTTLLSVTIPANTIGRNNNSIRAEIWFDAMKITTTDTKFNAYYGGLEFAKINWPAAGPSCSNATPCAGLMILDLQARNSTSSELGSMDFRIYTASTSSMATTALFGLPTFTTISATTTIDQTFSLTVTAGTAHASEQNVTMEKYTVSRIQAQ